MAYTINEDCISCGACEAECPVNCISAGDDTYVINADECIDCGSCAAVCPVSAPNPAE
ncbi:MAG: 4Fe-4S binding protein [Oscillospiraceae bacterium]|jgi:NAD-dependent dihydropyrimidine dehydrogenase PreA subunit|nr:4Fe-4S binding protein [Oscillospiraceae bacterium]